MIRISSYSFATIVALISLALTLTRPDRSALTSLVLLAFTVWFGWVVVDALRTYRRRAAQGWSPRPGDDARSP